MTLPSREEIDAFINALQLCVKSKIVEAVFKPGKNSGWLTLELKDIDSNDEKWDIFLTLLGRHAQWKKPHLMITEPSAILPLTPFLMLTRLDNTNMSALAEQDSQYRPYVRLLNLTPAVSGKGVSIRDITEASRHFFSVVADKEFTLRHLAERTGLTQATLSNFKAGQDIRLSTFFKLADVVGLDVILQPKKENIP